MYDAAHVARMTVQACDLVENCHTLQAAACNNFAPKSRPHIFSNLEYSMQLQNGFLCESSYAQPTHEQSKAHVTNLKVGREAKASKSRGPRLLSPFLQL